VPAAPEVKLPDDERIRAAVNEKNAQWEDRYRTIDGNNVYGGRSSLAYAPKHNYVSDRNAPAPFISNYKVMQEEMAQRDVLTANRDKHIWALLHGRDLPVDDSNLPPVSPVPTDMPGPNADGSFVYLKGEEAISKMTVHSHMKVNLFASEEQFPNWSARCKWLGTPKGGCGSRLGKTIPNARPRAKWATACSCLRTRTATAKRTRRRGFSAI
jgi:hypothetical protein